MLALIDRRGAQYPMVSPKWIDIWIVFFILPYFLTQLDIKINASKHAYDIFSYFNHELHHRILQAVLCLPHPAYGVFYSRLAAHKRPL